MRKWRQKVSRLNNTGADLSDVVFHEGFTTAIAIIRWRISAVLKHLVRSAASRLRPSVGKTQGEMGLEDDTPIKPGVLFIGYVEAGLGLGGSLRGLIDSISDKNFPFAIRPFNLNVESRYLGPFRPESYDLEHRYQINVVEMATDQLPLLESYLGRKQFSSSYNILRTYWELPLAPADWKPILQSVDEIWAPNKFVADAFRPIFPRMISIIPPCVEIKRSDIDHRGKFGFQDGVFYFLFSFDYFSFPARKNPIGVVRAFQAAFSKENKKVALIIKSTGSNQHFGDVRAVIDGASRKDPRIIVIDRTLTQEEILSLIGNCDCYVSLHRSEGFGLGMVEAMAHEKPVIGTDFSGSADFLSHATGFPVECRLRPVRDGEYLYSEGQVWAEPDIQSAVAMMREVVSLPKDAKDRALAGMAFVNSRYGKTNVGAMVEGRIVEILNQRTGT